MNLPVAELPLQMVSDGAGCIRWTRHRKPIQRSRSTLTLKFKTSGCAIKATASPASNGSGAMRPTPNAIANIVITTAHFRPVPSSSRSERGSRRNHSPAQRDIRGQSASQHHAGPAQKRRQRSGPPLYKENQRHQHYGGHLIGHRPQCQSPARSGGIQHTRNPVSGKGQGR